MVQPAGSNGGARKGIRLVRALIAVAIMILANLALIAGTVTIFAVAAIGQAVCRVVAWSKLLAACARRHTQSGEHSKSQ